MLLHLWRRECPTGSNAPVVSDPNGDGSGADQEQEDEERSQFLVSSNIRLTIEHRFER